MGEEVFPDVDEKRPVEQQTATRRKSIAFVYPDWRIKVPPGGLSYSLDLVAMGLAKQLAKSCNVALYIRGTFRERRSCVHEGIEYRRVSVLFDRAMARGMNTLMRFFRIRGLPDASRPFVASPLFFLGYALQVAWDLRRRKHDVVHIFIFDQFVPIIRRLNPDAKIVLHLHDHSQIQRNRALIGRRLAQCDLIIGCSAFITENVKARFPELADRCRTVQNGCDVDYIAEIAARGTPPADDVVRLLFVGRLSPEKGVHLLLEAFNAVVERFPNTELVLIGPFTVAPLDYVDPYCDDPYFNGLRRFFRNRDTYLNHLRSLLSPAAKERVVFAGEIAFSEVRRYYRSIDIFIFPTLWNEPFGLPLIEAMAAGVPVITTRSGATPEIIDDGTTGLIVQRGDSAQLREAILTLLGGDERRRAMGSAGHRHARQHFTIERHAAQMLEAYEGLF